MSEQRQSHLVFCSGRSWYALPAECAAEVVSFPALTRVPGSPAYLLGVFAHRGEVIPVVDLSQLTGKPSDGSKRAVLLRLSRGALALTASKVAGVKAISGKPAPLGVSGVSLHLHGPAKAGNNDVAVIEPEGLFELLSQGA